MVSDLDNNVFLMLGRIDGKIDTLVASHQELKDVQRQHDTRLTALEAQRQHQSGYKKALAAISAGIGAAVSMILPFLKDILNL